MERGLSSTPGGRKAKGKVIKKGREDVPFDTTGYTILCVLIILTVVMYPHKAIRGASPTLGFVFYYGWITAISTGAGVLPFYIVDIPNKLWLGVCNAVACGMMVAASYSLAHEGMTIDEGEPWDQPSEGVISVCAEIVGDTFSAAGVSSLSKDELNGPFGRTVLGVLSGIIFIVVTQKILDQHEDLKVGNFDGASAQKMVLIVFVMTLHSLTEGIGIGVSFGGASGMQLGQFISFSLALHNVPEGLAVALVLTSRGVSKLRSGLWAVFTSLPQPLMALPAFIFVQQFLPLLPVGLGFAAGAMAWVAVFELFMEAWEDAGLKLAVPVALMASWAMLYVQELIHDSTH